MTDAFDLIAPVVEAAKQNIPREPGDYAKDGCLFCGKCHTAKQTWVLGRLVPCRCSCSAQAAAKAESQQREREKFERIARLRTSGLQDEKNRSARFETAELSPQLEACRRYAERFQELCKENIGLLLWGAPGTGKTFAASCIANSLIDSLIPVMQTSFSKIIADLQADSKNMRQILDGLGQYDVLILDDLGTERQSAYALQLMYDVVDARYNDRKPLIVTTNLSLSDLKNPSDMAHQRIFGRIQEMCTPIRFDGENRRAVAAEAKLKAARSILGVTQ